MTPQTMITTAQHGASPNSGMPGDRLAMIAARRAFVAVKLHFIEAVASIDGTAAARLQAQVRGAEDPVDLWALRAPVLAALAGDDPVRRYQRRQLCSALDRLLPSELPSVPLLTV